MWQTEYEIKTKASPEAIWSLWSNVDKWHLWDDELDYAKLFAEFNAGTKGVLKPKGMPSTTFILNEVVYLKRFSDQSRLPFAKMDFIHEMRKENGALYLKHQVKISGFLSSLFGKLIGGKIKTELPFAMAKLSKQAETIDAFN